MALRGGHWCKDQCTLLSEGCADIVLGISQVYLYH